MNGAQAVLRTLLDGGVSTCFMNPGTSEMHFVAALDQEPQVHGILTLFEGVATGAADGFGRMADSPAAALMHLGPGLANGVANLHNARRAGTPVVAVVGDHAIDHKRLDAPLESDIDSLASVVSGWVCRSTSTQDAPADAAEAVRAARSEPGQVATLILPADVAWSEGAEPTVPDMARYLRGPDESAVTDVANAIRSRRPLGFLVGGRAARSEALDLAGAISTTYGCRLFHETFPSRMERGCGRVAAERLAYFGEVATDQLTGLEHLVLIGVQSPVSFFAYPGRTGHLVPPECRVHTLADRTQDALAALDALTNELGVGRARAARSDAYRPDPPDSGPITTKALARVVGALLPEGAIVADESNTSGTFLLEGTAGSPPHDWLTLTGGSIGLGLPLAVGAAVASPGRRILALESDGSALYTIQALWTMAREGLDVTTVILANRSYAILNHELKRVGAGTAGPRAAEMLALRSPDLDFVDIATGMGVRATRAESADQLATHLARALIEPGPSLIEAIISR